MRFGLALELSNVDLLNIDSLDTDIPSKYFACLHNVFKTSSRHVFKTSSRHVFKTSSGHVFKTSLRRLQDMSSIRVQHNNFSSSKTSSIRLEDVLQDVFKTSSRRIQDVWEDVKLLRWRRVEDIFKMSWRHLQMFAGKTLWQRYLERYITVEDFMDMDHHIN